MGSDRVDLTGCEELRWEECLGKMPDTDDECDQIQVPGYNSNCHDDDVCRVERIVTESLALHSRYSLDIAGLQ